MMRESGEYRGIRCIIGSEWLGADCFIDREVVNCSCGISGSKRDYVTVVVIEIFANVHSTPSPSIEHCPLPLRFTCCPWAFLFRRPLMPGIFIKSIRSRSVTYAASFMRRTIFPG